MILTDVNPDDQLIYLCACAKGVMFVVIIPKIAQSREMYTGMANSGPRLSGTPNAHFTAHARTGKGRRVRVYIGYMLGPQFTAGIIR